MTTDIARTRLSEIFAEEAAATVAAATATAAAANDGHVAKRRTPSAAPSLTYSDSGDERDIDDSSPTDEDDGALATPRRRRASTRLIAQNAADIRRITGESSTQLINRCCGGGCCMKLDSKADGVQYEHVPLPENVAFRSLQLKIDDEIPTILNNVTELSEQTTFLLPVGQRTTEDLDKEKEVVLATATASETQAPTAESPKGLSIHDMAKDLSDLDTTVQPPTFVQPHPPFHVFPARIHNTRELTRPGAEKRTYHFDLDVTEYPKGENIDFKVGGAIGVMAPNDSTLVDEILDLLMVPRFLRTKPVLLRTTTGRWPTVWGAEKAREIVTTRRDLLTWCSDVQSHPPTKALLRILAEYASNENEKKVLLYLCSAEGQGAFCDFRTGPHVSLEQILSAFPSARPPLDLLLSVLQPQMPRFYSLSNDPHESAASAGKGSSTRRVIEIAVTVHESSDWLCGKRTGIGSGFFERQALRFLEARSRGEEPELCIPMFKGLMANPLAKQFVPDGPMLLIGAGVGIAPFRGFVQRRLKTANCANKVWVLQGVRDSLVDELYSGEWGVHEDEVKRVVESRRGTGRYVQEEVKHQADLVWFVINSVDGRVFVCGSSRGMGEGVHEALIDVAMQKGNLDREEARKFWELKQEVGQYIAETW
ncbi:FAD/NAD(P)-binding oxidoreductase [Grosmannia clavigera kw1407]|uniref:FAD/NAD(P)-binding oxidoreductase n=1 Tax=Grosmannia clavigera (strain kw1407 / UAMH 11150) TaxID=655863 RepID=F0XM01_GROCL|nr:FAD/NAD(P)-binding oxidoreductase [Grosmannia clavigera kw1407]EFX01182.1 FAD/NAD(P)-binding oxidoreductase [Grosmannia clavigera kw1407]